MLSTKDLKAKFRTDLDLDYLRDSTGAIRNGLYFDQYGRVLQEYTDKDDKPDLRPVGLKGKGGY